MHGWEKASKELVNTVLTFTLAEYRQMMKVEAGLYPPAVQF